MRKALFVLTAVASFNLQAQTHKHMLAVVSKGLPGILLFDADTDEPICKATMDESPHEAAFSPDGKLLYVPVYSPANIGQPGPNGHTINTVQTSDCKIVNSMDTGEYLRPHFPLVGPDGMLYVTAEMKKSILIIDPKEHKIVGTLPTDSETTHFFAMTKDGKKIFTSNVNGKNLSVIDVPGRKVVKQIDTGTGNQRMTVSPNDKWFVTSVGQDKKVNFYRTSDAELDFSAEVEGGPFVARFSPDSKYLYEMGTAPRGETPAGIRVWKIDVATHKVIATSSELLGQGTGGIQVSPYNGRVYFTAYSGTVTALDPDTLKIVKQFPGDKTPDGLFFGELK